MRAKARLSFLPNSISRKDVFVFLVGVLSLIKVRVLGTFALAELLAMVSLFLIPWWRCLKNGKVRMFIKLAILWLVAVIVSDLYNGSSTVNSLKGSFNVVFLILDIPFVYWAFYDRPKRILYYWIGVGIGSLIQFYVFSSYDSEFEYDVWRVYAYDVLFIAVAGILYYNDFKKISLLLLEGFAVWSLFHSSRNIFLSATIAVVMLLYIGHLEKKSPDNVLVLYKKRFMGVFLSLGVGALIASNVYEYAASNGILGVEAQNKYEMQKNTEAGLASGRLDFVISSNLIIENPIWGYGSYAKDKNRYRERYLMRHGYYVSSEEKEDMLPGHSYFLGAWVYSGVLSAPFWLFVIAQIFLCLKNGTMLRNRRLMGIVVFLMLSYTWKIFFSPFADRILFASFMMILLALNTPANPYWGIGDTHTVPMPRENYLYPTRRKRSRRIFR